MRRIVAAGILLTTLLAAAPSPTADEIRALTDAGKNEEAAAAAQQLLAEREQRYGDRSLPVAEALDLLVRAQARAHLGTKEERLAAAERALAIKTQLLPPGHVDLAPSWYAIGLVHYLTRAYAEAEQPFRIALELVEAHHGAEHAETEIYLREYGSALFSNGKLQFALDVFARGERVSLATHGDGDSKTLKAVLNHALILKTLGHLDEAFPRYDRAIQILEQQQAPDQSLLAWIANSQATALATAGRLDEAVERSELAVQMARELAPNSSDHAKALSNLGAMLRRLGDFEEAERHLEASLALQAKTEPNPELTASSTVSLALIAYERGELERALALLARARAIGAEDLPPDTSFWGQFRAYEGRILRDLGRMDEAARSFAGALDNHRRNIGERNAHFAQTLLDLGELEGIRGHGLSALSRLRQAEEVLVEVVGSSHPWRVRALELLAKTEIDQGETAAAFDRAREAERLARENDRLIIRSASERRALARVARPRRGRDLLLALAAGPSATKDRIDAAYEAVVAGRAVVFDALVRRRRALHTHPDPRAAEVFRSLDEARSRLSSLYLDGSDENPTAFRNRIQVLRDRIDRLDTEAARFTKSPAPGRLTPSIPELVASLGADTALVSYVQADVSGEALYVAFVLNDRGPTRLVSLGPVASIDLMIADWRAMLTPGAVLNEGEARYRVVAERLRRAVWDPLQIFLVGAKDVYVVPDGNLHLMALDALPSESGYLVEKDPKFYYLTDECSLVNRRVRGGGRGLLAVGNPSFNGQPDSEGLLRGSARQVCKALRSRPFGDLPGAEREVRSVDRIWRETQAEPLVTLTGDQATVSAWLRQAPGQRILHLATHGFYLGDECNADGGVRGIGGVSPADRRTANTEGARVDPLVLSGLVFAGANREGPAGADDGILTAAEIGGLDLTGTELAVLSACRSGAGAVARGEGLFGLRRMFELAGVQHVVTNLWDADDRAAQEWIEVFYRKHLSESAPVATAARMASLAVYRSRRVRGDSTHPFFWAGWLVSGDPDVDRPKRG